MLSNNNSNNVNTISNLSLYIARVCPSIQHDPQHIRGLQLAQLQSCSATHVQGYDVHLNSNSSSIAPVFHQSWNNIYLLDARCEGFITNSCHERVFALCYDPFYLHFGSRYKPATLLSHDGSTAVVRYDRSDGSISIASSTKVGHMTIPTIITVTPALNTPFYKHCIRSMSHSNSNSNRKRHITECVMNDNHNHNTNSNKKRKVQALDHEAVAPFLAHMALEEAMQLQITNRFDHRDKFGRVFAASVAHKEGSRIEVHYEGWPSKWNVWSDIRTELWKFSPYRSISRRPRHRFVDLKVGDYIDVYPSHIEEYKYKGWKYAEIKQMDGESGQVQVMFNNRDDCVYWVHLDDTSEVAVFATKANIESAAYNEQTDIMNEIRNECDEWNEKMGKKKVNRNANVSSDDSSSDSDEDDDIKQQQEMRDISTWTGDDIYEWIMSVDGERFGKYEALKAVLNEEQVTGNDLMEITEHDLKEFGIKKFCDKKFLWNKIQTILPPKQKGDEKENDTTKDDAEDDIPNQFLDPITYEIMSDPVLCSKSGQTYERKTIMDWIQTDGHDPITRQKIKEKHLVPNRGLKELIQEWNKKHSKTNQ